MARLGDICTIVSGSTPKSNVPEYWDGNVKWITPAELTESSYIINDSVRHITELGVAKTGLKPFPKGTVILSSRAPIGKTAIAGCEMYCNQGFKNLICSDRINPRYLYWFLTCNTEYLNSLGRGATFKEISKEIVANIEIPLPPIDQQIAIAERFEKISELISLRKEQFSKLDQLVKARFVELFGDIVHDHTFPMVNLAQLVNIGSSKRIFANEYVDTGIPFYRSKEIRELGNGEKPSTELFIKNERYDKIKQQYGVPQVGDILIAAIGATIGYSWVVDTQKPFYYKDGNLICLSVKNGVNSVFLNHAIKVLIEDFKKNGVAGSAQLALTIEKMERMQIAFPPLSVQEQFATIAEQTDKTKLTIQASLDKLELLKKTLMQQYFG